MFYVFYLYDAAIFVFCPKLRALRRGDSLVCNMASVSARATTATTDYYLFSGFFHRTH